VAPPACSPRKTPCSVNFAIETTNYFADEKVGRKNEKEMGGENPCPLTNNVVHGGGVGEGKRGGVNEGGSLTLYLNTSQVKCKRGVNQYVITHFATNLKEKSGD
jgi:hypothetical protein